MLCVQLQETTMSASEDRPLPTTMVVLKDAFRQNRLQKSRSSDDSSTHGTPSNPDRGSQDSRTYMSDEYRNFAPHNCVENQQDFPNSAVPNSGESSTESTGNPERQFVVSDDDDESVTDMQSEPMNRFTSALAIGSSAADNCFLKCSMCERVFTSQQRLKLHVNKHMGVKPFACPQCPANFNTMASFQRHRRAHKTSMANIQTHTCNLCNAQFSHVQHLTAHLKIHAEKSRSCPHCGIYIGGLRSLQKHIREEHPLLMKIGRKKQIQKLPGRDNLYTVGKKTLSLSTAGLSKPVSCRLCGRQFATNRALQGHMKGHSRLYQWNPRKCRCGLLLADEAEYQRHLKNGSCNSSDCCELEPPRQDSSRSLSPVSPNNCDQVIVSPTARQMNPRSRSLDLSLPTGLLPLPQSIICRTDTDPALSPAVSQPASLTPAPRIVQSRSLSHLHDGPSLVNEEASSSTVSTSAQSEHKPLDSITIKTEGWSEVVNVIHVHSDSIGSDETGRDATPDESQSSGQPTPVLANQAEENVSDHDGRFHAQERPEVTSQQSIRQAAQYGQRQPAYHAHQSGKEARSSGIHVGPHGDMVPDLYQERTHSESPGTQITSSQSCLPASNLSTFPNMAGEGVLEGLPWRCSYCGVTFEDSLMYVIHKGCHEPGSPFRCSMCGEQCSDKVNFMLHFVRGQHTKPTHV